MGLWKSIKNAAKSVGKFVKKNWKAIVGITAAVVIPFAAPAIAGAIGGSAFLASTAVGGFLKSAAGAALVGAGLGAGSAALTGGNPLLGAALGGIGAYGVASAGGLSGMFGGIGGGAAGAPAAATPALGAGGAVTGGQGIVALGGTGAATAASSGIGSAITGTIGSLATKLATNPQAIGALSQLAMTMFNKDMGELTKEERAQLEEAAKQAGTDRALFEQKVMEARKVINMGTPNPEQAYANARFNVENQMADVRRGMPAGLQESAERKAAIAGAQSGAFNVAADYGAAAQTRQAGLNMMPQQAPTGYNQLAMDTYASVEARRQKLAEQQSKAVGQLFGALA
jgi:hypothetical protein